MEPPGEKKSKKETYFFIIDAVLVLRRGAWAENTAALLLPVIARHPLAVASAAGLDNACVQR